MFQQPPGMATATQRAIKHQLAGHRHQGIDDLLLKHWYVIAFSIIPRTIQSTKGSKVQAGHRVAQAGTTPTGHSQHLGQMSDSQASRKWLTKRFHPGTEKAPRGPSGGSRGNHAWEKTHHNRQA